MFELTLEAKELLKQKIKGEKIISTTDHWTSRAKENYASLVIHWIDGFELHHAVLSVHVFKGSTKANFLYDDFFGR